MKTEFDGVKKYYDSQVAILPVDGMVADEIKKYPTGEVVHCTVQTIPDRRKRSNEQLNLYWASCTLFAENTDRKITHLETDEDGCEIPVVTSWTKETVSEWTKISLRYIDYWIVYQNKNTGEMTTNLKTKSISFAELEHLEACGYFTDAFNLHSETMGMSAEEWIDNVKKHMKSGKI